MNWIKVCFSVWLMVCWATLAAAAPVLELQWEDLAGKIEFEDPFEKLTSEQIYHLYKYVQVAELKDTDRSKITASMEEEARIAETTLREEGVDIEYLITISPEIQKKRLQSGSAVVPDLDGQKVKLPGYLLPLEFNQKKVTEFLLVPWVGACIHTPPPPPNQIVYVSLKKGYDGMEQFVPVWVTGEMQVRSSKKDLFLVDGEAGIETGYTLIAEKVSPYTQKED